MGTSRLAWVARVAAAGILACAGVAIAAGPAGAATFTVNNTGTTGAGSLNQAIADATAHPGSTITFAPNTNGHLIPEPDTIEANITVKGNGAGVTLIAGEFNVNSGGKEKVVAAFSGLSIGDFNINSGFGSSTTASVTNVNVTTDGLNINSGFNNSSTTASFTNVKIIGGIDANSETSTTNLSLSNVSVSGASGEPLTANTSGTTVTVVGSTFSNSKDAIDVVDGAKLRMTNSTLTGLGEGGVRSTGNVTLQNVTIAKNNGPAVAPISGTMSVGDSILGPNTLGGENGSHECQIGDASFTSHGGNVSDDASCHPIAGDHANTQSKLGAFGANGGATSTFVPLAGSAAIDGGVAAGCPSTDQRGVKRPQDGDKNGSAVCDSGAVEVAGAVATVTTVTTVTPTTASAPVTAAATPTTIAAAPELPRTGSSSGPLAVLGFALLLAGAATLYSPRAARKVARR